MLAHPMAQRIEHWPLDKLIPYARNPRTHSDAQVAQIAASIEEFGFLNPILVDTKAGILAGHGRLLAARKPKLGEAPVSILDHLTETQKRAFVIVDNQLALNAGWDDELLSAYDLHWSNETVAQLWDSLDELRAIAGVSQDLTQPLDDRI